MATQTFETTGEARAAAPSIVAGRAQAASRLVYIDNIRTFLTILVLLHHIMITYSGSGSWIYTEKRQDLATEVVGGIFTTVNQAFFMGLFLLISGYFVPGAYDRKGMARFWVDRLVRLGIPLLVYSWVLNPLFIYWYLRTTEGLRISFWSFFPRQYFGFGNLVGHGPLWFVETLLIFTMVYAIWRWIARLRPSVSQPAKRTIQRLFPSNLALALFALGMGLAGFAVRLRFPMDWNFMPLNLQLPNFAQYITMFVAGLLAYSNGWLANMPDTAGRTWLRIAGVVVLLYVPGALLGGALESDLPFRGGWTWQSLYYSLWEAYLCLGLCMGVVYLFRRYANQQGRISAELSRNAYTAYIIQAPVITAVSLQLRGLDFHPLLKFILASLIAALLCFGIGGLLRRLPYADRVL